MRRRRRPLTARHPRLKSRRHASGRETGTGHSAQGTDASLLQRTTISEATLGRVLSFVDGEIHFIHEPKPANVATGQIEWTLLAALKNAIENNSFTVDGNDVKRLCDEKGFLDPSNFWKILRPQREAVHEAVHDRRPPSDAEHRGASGTSQADRDARYTVARLLYDDLAAFEQRLRKLRAAVRGLERMGRPPPAYRKQRLSPSWVHVAETSHRSLGSSLAPQVADVTGAYGAASSS